MFDWGSKIRHCVYPFLSRVLSAGKVTMVSEVSETFSVPVWTKGITAKTITKSKTGRKAKTRETTCKWVTRSHPALASVSVAWFFKKKVWNWISYVNSIKHASYKRLLHFMQFHSVNANKYHCIYFKHGLVDI